MPDSLLRTPLYAWHAAHGARLVPFGGWEMPVQYTSIVEEHTATRTAAGLFDISHMGRLSFLGPDTAAFLDRLLTNHVATLKPSQIRYSLVCNESGGVLDDVLVYRTPAPGHTDHMLVVNASNRLKIVDWIHEHLSPADDVDMQDMTRKWGMIALQGPRSLDIVQPLVKAWLNQPPSSGGPPTAIARLDSIDYYHFVGIETCGSCGILSRTGYTGEDGCELVVPSQKLAELWEKIIAAGEPLGLKACGLGARDTLRLEAGMPLYGHELNEQTDPFMAGLDFAVKLTKPDFIGKRALLSAKKARDVQLSRRRVGLELEGKRIAREGFEVFQGDAKVGFVTSGTFSPTLAKSIAMAYVQPDVAKPGLTLSVDIRGQRVPARVVKPRFYEAPK